MTEQAEAAPQGSGAHRHGSRWLHAQPNEEEVKEWFEQQPLHKGMNHGPYMGGIVLIGATEKFKRTMQQANGALYVKEQEQAVFVPYVKVDTRISYFHDLARQLSGDDDPFRFIAVTEPVPQTIIENEKSAYFNAHLPEGFSVLPIRNGRDDSINRYLVATFRVKIIEREFPDRLPVLQGVGSKQSAQSRNYADDNVVMKCETGAIGRALGVAGILVVGTGVATAEDMQEAAAGPVGPAGASSAEPILPQISTGPETPAEDVGGEVPAEATERPLPITEDETDEKLRERAKALQAELEKDHPEVWATYRDWWVERQFGPIAEVYGAALRGAVIKLERDLDQAKTDKLAAASV